MWDMELENNISLKQLSMPSWALDCWTQWWWGCIVTKSFSLPNPSTSVCNPFVTEKFNQNKKKN